MSDAPMPIPTLSSLPAELQRLIYEALLAEWMYCATHYNPETSEWNLGSAEWERRSAWKFMLRQRFTRAAYAALALRATCRQFRDIVVPLTASPHANFYGCSSVSRPYAKFALGSMMLWASSRRDRLTLDEHAGLYSLLSANSCWAPRTDEDQLRKMSNETDWLRCILRCFDALFCEEALAYTALDPNFWHDAAPGAGQTAVVEGSLVLRPARDVLHFVPSHSVSRAAAIERCKHARWRTNKASHVLAHGMRAYSVRLQTPGGTRRIYLTECFEEFADRVRCGGLRLPQLPLQEGGDPMLCYPPEQPSASTARNLLDILDKGLWRTSHLYC